MTKKAQILAKAKEVLQHTGKNGMQEHYAVLGVQPNASAEEIKKAARQLQLLYFSSDKHAGIEFDEEEALTVRNALNAVKLAYEILGNEQKRAGYDAECAGENAQAEFFKFKEMAADFFDGTIVTYTYDDKNKTQVIFTNADEFANTLADFTNEPTKRKTLFESLFSKPKEIRKITDPDSPYFGHSLPLSQVLFFHLLSCKKGTIEGFSRRMLTSKEERQLKKPSREYWDHFFLWNKLFWLECKVANRLPANIVHEKLSYLNEIVFEDKLGIIDTIYRCWVVPLEGKVNILEKKISNISYNGEYKIIRKHIQNLYNVAPEDRELSEREFNGKLIDALSALYPFRAPPKNYFGAWTDMSKEDVLAAATAKAAEVAAAKAAKIAAETAKVAAASATSSKNTPPIVSTTASKPVAATDKDTAEHVDVSNVSTTTAATATSAATPASDSPSTSTSLNELEQIIKVVEDELESLIVKKISRLDQDIWDALDRGNAVRPLNHNNPISKDVLWHVLTSSSDHTKPFTDATDPTKPINIKSDQGNETVESVTASTKAMLFKARETKAELVGLLRKTAEIKQRHKAQWDANSAPHNDPATGGSSRATAVTNFTTEIMALKDDFSLRNKSAAVAKAFVNIFAAAAAIVGTLVGGVVSIVVGGSAKLVDSVRSTQYANSYSNFCKKQLKNVWNPIINAVTLTTDSEARISEGKEAVQEGSQKITTLPIKPR